MRKNSTRTSVHKEETVKYTADWKKAFGVHCPPNRPLRRSEKRKKKSHSKKKKKKKKKRLRKREKGGNFFEEWNTSF